MSLYNRLWVLVVPTAFMLALGSISPVHADPPAQPPPPVPSDVCGGSKDRFYTTDSATASDGVGWKDSHGTLYSPNEWNSTGGAASVTLTAMVWGEGGYAEYTYPAMTFGVEPDSSCVDTPDTVTTKIVACNPNNNGTRVAFTYTNTPENGRSHSDPYVIAERWDHGQSAVVQFSFDEVADGQSVTVIGGDSLTGPGFFLSPGTYDMKLTTDEAGTRKLPNRLFVPACGDYDVPPGDPMGGPNPVKSKPRAFIAKCYHHKVRVTMDSRKATQLTRYRLVVNPKQGNTKVKVHRVAASDKKVIVLRQQKTGTVVKLTFAGQRALRKLRC